MSLLLIQSAVLKRQISLQCSPWAFDKQANRRLGKNELDFVNSACVQTSRCTVVATTELTLDAYSATNNFYLVDNLAATTSAEHKRAGTA